MSFLCLRFNWVRSSIILHSMDSNILVYSRKILSCTFQNSCVDMESFSRTSEFSVFIYLICSCTLFNLYIYICTSLKSPHSLTGFSDSTTWLRNEWRFTMNCLTYCYSHSPF